MTRRHYFIQGGGRGLGLALVERLLARDERAQVIVAVRAPESAEPLRRLIEREGEERVQIVALDLTDESSIAAARRHVGELTERLDLLMTCAGLLHDDSGLWPEKRLADIDPANLARSFAVNATGPLLMIKHFHDLLTHGDRAVIASLSARVGSISDNGRGGWYAYRASKAAQNQFTRTAAIELRRHSKQLICVGLHPGTVDTGLSEPFQHNVPAKQLQSAATAAGHLLDVIAKLSPEDSGQIFDWAGEVIAP
ncbi:3-oxoacyl-acyl-carrier protein reductase [Salinisphaera shabanensis E1L3A]|uniref:3-oxoacyl-acyl-carrier protein reductase n=1 Tax=Salinisphaera shabanensis E1L3A TaxID=1033802 RepID=U2FX17_9GAMM|nr:SDR family oxidoreductase [Salinisphaera shabanensis]ERJ20409.1 3-oxoacyl-acyl-carrier protein reductase [Salinisphaera shabanensis E1L3A]